MADKIIQLTNGNDLVYTKETSWESLGRIWVYEADRIYNIDLTSYKEIFFKIDTGDSFTSQSRTIPSVALPMPMSDWVNALPLNDSYCCFYAGQLTNSFLYINRLWLYNWDGIGFNFYGKK